MKLRSSIQLTKVDRYFMLLFLTILFVIQVRGDGYFPFPKSLSVEYLLIIVFCHTIILIAAMIGAATVVARNDTSSVVQGSFLIADFLLTVGAVVQFCSYWVLLVCKFFNLVTLHMRAIQ